MQHLNIPEYVAIDYYNYTFFILGGISSSGEQTKDLGFKKGESLNASNTKVIVRDIPDNYRVLYTYTPSIIFTGKIGKNVSFNDISSGKQKITLQFLKPLPDSAKLDFNSKNTYYVFAKLPHSTITETLNLVHSTPSYHVMSAAEKKTIKSKITKVMDKVKEQAKVPKPVPKPILKSNLFAELAVAPARAPATEQPTVPSLEKPTAPPLEIATVPPLEKPTAPPAEILNDIFKRPKEKIFRDYPVHLPDYIGDPNTVDPDIYEYSESLRLFMEQTNIGERSIKFRLAPIIGTETHARLLKEFKNKIPLIPVKCFGKRTDLKNALDYEYKIKLYDRHPHLMENIVPDFETYNYIIEQIDGQLNKQRERAKLKF